MSKGKGHSKAYSKIHSREECVGTTRSGAKVKVQTNSRPLDSMVDKESLRTERVYNWKTGKSETRDLDLLTNAQRQINRVTISTVTSGRRQRKEDKNNEGPGLYPAVPTLGGRY